MSLPSKMRFMKGEEIVKSMFVNCGWFFERRDIVEYMHKAVLDHIRSTEDTIEDIRNLEYDDIVLYNHKVKRSDVAAFMDETINLETLLERIEVLQC